MDKVGGGGGGGAIDNESEVPEKRWAGAALVAKPLPRELSAIYVAL